MSTHLTEEQIVRLLQGALDEPARDDARRHVAECTACAEILAHEAAVDEVLWEARKVFRELPVATAPHPVRAPAPRRSVAGWVLGGGVGLAATAALVLAGNGVPASGTQAAGLLAWQNVIFYIPLIVGILLVVGSAFGGHEHEAEVDHDVHVGGHDHESGAVGKALELLGVGQVPLTIVLMMASLLFGGIGVIVNTVLAAAGVPAALYPLIAIVCAFVGMVVLTSSAVRLLRRTMPTMESYHVTRHGFAGCTGTLLLPANRTEGYAQVKDREGNVHNLRCHTEGDELAKGEAILVVAYEEETQTYLVSKSPV